MISAVTYFLLISLISLCAYFYRSLREKSYKLPPGPRPWPIIGNLPHIIGKDLHLSMAELGEKFGKLFWLKLGSDNVLVVNGIDSTVEAFVKKAKVYSGRPAKRKTIDIMLGDGKDIVMSDSDEELKFYRRVVHSYLSSQHENTRARILSIIGSETSSIVDTFGNFSDKDVAFDPKLYISRVVANILCESILNQRFDEIDGDLQGQLSIIQDIVDSLESFNIVDIMPFLANFPIPSLQRFKKSLAKKDLWIKPIIAEHKRTLGDADRDLLDVLLRLQKQARENGEESRAIKDLTINHIVYELFGGGIESSTLVVLWFLVYMLHYPQWQKKVAEEVRTVSQLRGGVHPEDRHLYPILDNCIKETMRLATILPVGFPHRTVIDSQLGGFDIPKDTIVITNLWAIHHDEDVWVEPSTFNPDRFMKNGQKVNHRGYLPFGIGTRVCLGSFIAKLEAFMIIAQILSNFDVVPENNSHLPDIVGQCGLTHRTQPYKIRVRRRDINNNSR